MGGAVMPVVYVDPATGLPNEEPGRASGRQSPLCPPQRVPLEQIKLVFCADSSSMCHTVGEDGTAGHIANLHLQLKEIGLAQSVML